MPTNQEEKELEAKVLAATSDALVAYGRGVRTLLFMAISIILLGVFTVLLGYESRNLFVIVAGIAVQAVHYWIIRELSWLRRDQSTFRKLSTLIGTQEPPERVIPQIESALKDLRSRH
jgi:hypothetical protein